MTRSLSFLLCIPALACGKTTLDPISGSPGDAGTAGQAGAGSGGTAGSGASGGAASGGQAGAGGGGGAAGCTTENPAGCTGNSCGAGYLCKPSSECKPSSCQCVDGAWGCTKDCGGGVCEIDPNGYFARFGYWQGQQNLQDFCVAYKKNASGYPDWEPQGLLSQNGYTIKELEGLDKLTRYLPLSGKPIAFGASYGASCSTASISGNGEVKEDHNFHTVLSVPYSNEPDVLWLVKDPGPGSTTQQGVRLVNATATSYDLSVSIDGKPFGPIKFQNSPLNYESAPGNHVLELKISDSVHSTEWTVNYGGVDLLPLISTTLFISGGPFMGYSALGCFDAKPNGAKWSDCWFVAGAKKK